MISQAGLHATVYYMKLGECFQNNDSGGFLATIKHRQNYVPKCAGIPAGKDKCFRAGDTASFCLRPSRDSGDISSPTAAAVSR